MLEAEKVREIFNDCFFKEEEIVDGKPVVPPVMVQGITATFGFHPNRLMSHKEQIRQMLLELEDTFMASKGGGGSFLAACNDKHGHQWGEHRNMEQLFTLGMGVHLVEYCAPKQMWKVLPGGMPYLRILDQTGDDFPPPDEFEQQPPEEESYE